MLPTSLSFLAKLLLFSIIGNVSSADENNILSELEGKKIEFCSVSNDVEANGVFRFCDGFQLGFSNVEGVHRVELIRGKGGTSKFAATETLDVTQFHSRFSDLHQNASECLNSGLCTLEDAAIHYGPFDKIETCTGTEIAVELQELSSVFDFKLPSDFWRRLYLCYNGTEILGILSEKYITGDQFFDGYLGVFDNAKSDFFKIELE